VYVAQANFSTAQRLLWVETGRSCTHAQHFFPIGRLLPGFRFAVHRKWRDAELAASVKHIIGHWLAVLAASGRYQGRF